MSLITDRTRRDLLATRMGTAGAAPQVGDVVFKRNRVDRQDGAGSRAARTAASIPPSTPPVIEPGFHAHQSIRRWNRSRRLPPHTS